MKKVLGLIGLLTLLALLITKSSYVELNEFFVIIVALSVITIITSVFFKKKGEIHAAKGSTAFVGFFLFWVLALFDLIADHVLYFQPTGNEDGRALTLGEKIQEFSDDLFIMWIITAVIVFIISFILSKIILRVMYKSA